MAIPYAAKHEKLSSPSLLFPQICSHDEQKHSTGYEIDFSTVKLVLVIFDILPMVDSGPT